MPETSGRRVVVVDGSNLATEGRTTPSLRQLDEAVKAYALEDPGVEIVVVVDASFEHRIDPSERQELIDAELHGEVVSPPAGAIGRGDAFVLRIAERTGARVLSNDSFQEFHAEHPWLFDDGRLIGGKPVPGVGWIFTPRIPVRGPKSRQVTGKSKRGGSLSPPVKAAELARAAKKVAARKMPAALPDGSAPKVGDVWPFGAPTAANGTTTAPSSAPEGTNGAVGVGGAEGAARAERPAAVEGKATKNRRAGAAAKAVKAIEPEGPTGPVAKRVAAKRVAAKKAPAKKATKKAVAKKAVAKKAVAKKAGVTGAGVPDAPTEEPIPVDGPDAIQGPAAAEERGAPAPARKRAATRAPAEASAISIEAIEAEELAPTKAVAKRAGATKAAAKKATKKALPANAPAESTVPEKAAAKKAATKKTASKVAKTTPAAGSRTAGAIKKTTAKRSSARADVQPTLEPLPAHEEPAATEPAATKKAPARGRKALAPTAPSAARAAAREDPVVKSAIDQAMAEALSLTLPASHEPGGGARSGGARSGGARSGGARSADRKTEGKGGATKEKKGKSAAKVRDDKDKEKKDDKRSRRRSPMALPAVNEPLAFINFVVTYPLQSEFEGEVVSFTSHGAMVDVDLPDGSQLHCYIPLSAMGDPPPTKARQVLARGERRPFVLVGLDPPRRVAELALPGVLARTADAAR